MKLHKVDNKPSFSAIRIPGNPDRRLSSMARRFSKTYGIDLVKVELGNRKIKYLMTTYNSALEKDLLGRLRGINSTVCAVKLSALNRSELGVVRSGKKRRYYDFFLQAMLGKPQRSLDYTVQ